MSIVASEVSTYQTLIAFRFLGLRPDARSAPMYTELLRAAVLSKAGDDAPAELHGHGAEGRTHVAFLALPDIRRRKGSLAGLAVAIPTLPDGRGQEIARAVLDLCDPNTEGVITLNVYGVGAVELVQQSNGYIQDEWCRPSSRWATITPVVLDRFPRNRTQEPEIVAASLRMLGFPDPVDVQVRVDPVVPGAVRMAPGDLPKKMQGRLFRHVSVRFPWPVPGPVLVGGGRYLGVGLFAPC